MCQGLEKLYMSRNTIIGTIRYQQCRKRRKPHVSPASQYPVRKSSKRSGAKHANILCRWSMPSTASRWWLIFMEAIESVQVSLTAWRSACKRNDSIETSPECASKLCTLTMAIIKARRRLSAVPGSSSRLIHGDCSHATNCHSQVFVLHYLDTWRSWLEGMRVCEALVVIIWRRDSALRIVYTECACCHQWKLNTLTFDTGGGFVLTMLLLIGRLSFVLQILKDQ